MKTSPTIEYPHTSHSAAGETTFIVPGHCLIEGFTELSAATQGIDLREMAAHDLIYARTMNSEYRLLLLDPATRRVRVQGGKLFVAPTEAIVRGSTCGGSMLRVGWIGIGLQLELVYHLEFDQPRNMLTSPVEWLQTERARL